MSPPILEIDAEIRLPQVTVLRASAGSGKTYALAKRFVQFLLSSRIPQNQLRHILAITFSNNAAKEMRERILSWLKDIYWGDSDRVEDLSQVLSLRKEHLPAKAGAIIEEILRNYTEFQVKTIDSFMTSIYKASAIDLGHSPDFEIIMAPRNIMAHAFHRFLRRVRKDSPEAHFLKGVLEIILESRGGESRYLWEPSKDLLEEMVELHERLSGTVGEARIIDVEKEMESTKQEICHCAEKLNHLIETSGLTKHKGSSFERILENVRGRRFPDLLDKGLVNPPVIKPKKGGEAAFEEISKEWHRLGSRIKKYKELYGWSYYTPYLRAYQAFKGFLEEVKRREGKIFIHDINKKLSSYLHHEMIPDIYFRIGETIYHYLIDEFQDTSPIQWRNLFPLIENSLSQGGSLFAVGDTKQAIYGFRNADYKIMRKLELENPFSSAAHRVKELEINYRSLEGVVRFSERFFKTIVAGHLTYREAASRSGLIDYEQQVKEGQIGSGYVEVFLCDEDADQPREKQKLQELIGELKGRGYAYSDIAVLTHRNEDVINLTTWLNEIKVPFISYSSLDIRRRKLTVEVVALLRFLDSPPDDLSFATFALGDIFRSALETEGRPFGLDSLHQFFFRNRESRPLYKAFQREFPDLWEVYFEELFGRTGYLPLYDLVNEIYHLYRVFDRFRQEEATLVKILEVIKNFEGEGRNNPGDFLREALEEEGRESDWTIDVPSRVDAVRVMTIHKAKGMGFPVAVLLLYEEPSRSTRYVLHEETEGVHLLKLNKKILDACSFFEERYQEERLKDVVNKLNTLYVGLTRAEDELYVIGVRGKKREFPLDLLQGVESPTGLKKTPRVRPSTTTEESWKLNHQSERLRFPFPAIEKLNLEERRRGEFIHRVLYLIDDIGEWMDPGIERLIQRVNEEFNTDYPVSEMKRNLLEFLSQEEIRPFFEKKTGRVIRKEHEFSDREGALFRMDRVMIEGDRISAIDYKTGTDRKTEEDYVLQLRNYLWILKEIYPGKSVEGMIAYVDLKEVRKIP